MALFGQMSMRDMRYELEEMKKELRETLIMCRNHRVNDYHNVIFIMSELLFKAVESLQMNKPLICSNLLPSAFNSIDRIGKTADAKEVIFYKYARVFILFMDLLNGGNTPIPESDNGRLQQFGSPPLATSDLQGLLAESDRGHANASLSQRLSYPSMIPHNPVRRYAQPARKDSFATRNSSPHSIDQRDIVSSPPPRTQTPVQTKSEAFEEDDVMLAACNSKEIKEEPILEDEMDIKEENQETLRVWNDIEQRINSANSHPDQPGCSRDELKIEEEWETFNNEHRGEANSNEDYTYASSVQLINSGKKPGRGIQLHPARSVSQRCHLNDSRWIEKQKLFNLKSKGQTASAPHPFNQQMRLYMPHIPSRGPVRKVGAPKVMIVNKMHPPHKTAQQVVNDVLRLQRFSKATRVSDDHDSTTTSWIPLKK